MITSATANAHQVHTSRRATTSAPVKSLPPNYATLMIGGMPSADGLATSHVLHEFGFRFLRFLLDMVVVTDGKFLQAGSSD